MGLSYRASRHGQPHSRCPEPRDKAMRPEHEDPGAAILSLSVAGRTYQCRNMERTPKWLPAGQPSRPLGDGVDGPWRRHARGSPLSTSSCRSGPSAACPPVPRCVPSVQARREPRSQATTFPAQRSRRARRIANHAHIGGRPAPLRPSGPRIRRTAWSAGPSPLPHERGTSTTAHRSPTSPAPSPPMAC